MVERDKSAVSTEHCYRLSREDLLKWWQVYSSIKFSFREEDSKFKNSSLRVQFLFLATTPFIAAMWLYVAMTGESGSVNWSAVTYLMLELFVIFLVMLVNFVDSLMHHVRLVTEVRSFEGGIILKSSFLQWRLNWEQIEEFYPIQNGDYVLKARDSGEFILVEDLSNSSSLFALIDRNISKSDKTFSVNVRQPCEFLDAKQSVCLALVIAVTLHLMSRWPNILELDVLLPVSIVIGACLWYWVHLKNFASTIRLGEESFRVITRFGATEYEWQHVLSVKKRGVYYFVKTRRGWFFAIPEKKSPLEARLIECRDKLELVLK